MSIASGKFDEENVTSMEESLVCMIGSYMYPPTAGSFILVLLRGFSVSPHVLDLVLETCQFMIELAACGEYISYSCLKQI